MVEKENSWFGHFSIQRVPRGDNKEEDRLARFVSSAAMSLDPGIIVKHLPKPCIKTEEDKEVNMASPEPEWTNQIIKYLKNGELPEDKEEAKKMRTRESQ